MMGRGSSGSRDEQMGRTLDTLLAAYRNVTPDPEASADFMPRLWSAIEARRSASYSLGRWTKAMVTAAAAICILLGLLQVYLPTQPVFYTQTYIEALQEESAATGGSTYLEALWLEEGGNSYQ
jgi:hypothetical protein